MPKQTYNILAPHTTEKLFNLVTDIESYPEFLPWIVAARILKREESVIIAELVIKYKFFRSKYTSKVTLIPNEEVIVELVEGPFKHLKNHWKFTKKPEGVQIDFLIDFELESDLLNSIIGKEFENHSKEMIDAFIRRAEDSL